MIYTFIRTRKIVLQRVTKGCLAEQTKGLFIWKPIYRLDEITRLDDISPFLLSREISARYLYDSRAISASRYIAL